MDKKRVVITGLGIIASNGIGREAFFKALAKGISGIKPISLFDTSEFEIKAAGEIKDFAPEQFLGPKGLRILDRSTKLVNCAAKLALEDAKLEINEENACNVGVSIGNTLGSLQSVCDFDIEAIKEGPRYVNPALFPNTVVNSAASQVSVRFDIKGFNITISTGFTASLDAINYASDFLKTGRADIVLSGGVEELCVQTFIGFYKTGLMRKLNIGEGSALLVLEDLNSALGRGANIHAEVLGFGSGWGGKQGIKKAIAESMDNSGIAKQDIDYIYSGVNSDNKNDVAETKALEELFGKRKDMIINCIKPLTGECYSASGSLQAAAGLGAIEGQGARNVLINTFGPFGNNASLVISKFSEDK